MGQALTAAVCGLAELMSKRRKPGAMENQQVHGGFHVDEGQQPNPSQLPEKARLGRRIEAEPSDQHAPVGFLVAKPWGQIFPGTQRLPEGFRGWLG